MRLIDMRPDPAVLLQQLTEELVPASLAPGKQTVPIPKMVRVVLGIELLEDHKKHAPTYPFHSRFQFDEYSCGSSSASTPCV